MRTGISTWILIGAVIAMIVIIMTKRAEAQVTCQTIGRYVYCTDYLTGETSSGYRDLHNGFYGSTSSGQTFRGNTIKGTTRITVDPPKKKDQLCLIKNGRIECQ